MKILVTSFEPFGGDKLNSAQEALRYVPDEILGAKIVKCCLPVVFGRSAEILRVAVSAQRHEARRIAEANGDVVLFDFGVEIVDPHES